MLSDDFSGDVLDPVWIIDGSAGTTVQLGVSATDAFLELSTPDGDHGAPWNGAGNPARAMQQVSDGDFGLEARFLTTPTQQYQSQGFLVEQDAQNWIRFDTYSDGSKLYAFAAVTVNGVSTAKFNVVIPGSSAPYLRLTRSGDQWTFQYSSDGVNWTTAGSFTHVLTVTAAGLFAGNEGQAAGYTAEVDYFENTADPIVDEDGSFVPPNIAPEAGDDALATPVDAALVIDVAADLLGNDSDANGDTLSLVSFTQPAFGTLADNGDGTLAYTPAAGYAGPDSFTYAVSDGADTSTASVTVNVADPVLAVSDDFSGDVLDPVWTIDGAAGTTVQLGASATDAFLELSTPDGDHGAPWNGAGNPARAMQAVSDGDFGLEARFLTTPTQQYQSQGFLVEQDAQNWIRFDTYSDGSKLHAFAATTVNGVSTAKFNVVIPGSSAPYLRLTRSGDQWTFQYSTDGANWATAGSFTHVLTVTAAGLFAGNEGQAAGYTAEVDYFESSTDPIAIEDPPNNVPEANGDVVETDQNTALVIDVAADLLGNDTDANGDALSFAGFTQPEFGALADNGDGTLAYTPAAGFTGPDSFTYTVSDGEDTSEPATVSIQVVDPTSAPPVAGDDSFATDEDTPAVFDVFANDSDPDGDALNLVSFTQPANGTLIDNGDGTLTYTPDPNFSGDDGFTYTIDDGRGRIASATATITVNAVNDAPTAQADMVTTGLDQPLVLDIGAALLANDSDVEDDALSLSGFTTPGHGTLIDNGDGTLTYSPAPGFVGTDSFTYTVSDGSASSAPATVYVNVGLPGEVFSDDFNTESLLPGWSLEGPTGGINLVSAGTEAYAELVVDAGPNNGAWNTNRSTRLMQAASNEDFGIESKFLSTPSQAYHIQGLLVEQDGQNWIRFDTVFDGTKLRVFAATTTNGISSARIDVVVPTGGAGFLRVERSGDQWTLKYSSDGTNWTTAGSFAHQLNVTAAGVFAGNEGQATGYTAEVDYVFNTAAPVIPEDAIPIPPVATDDVLTTSGGVPLVIDIASDLLGNDSDLNNDPLFLSGFGAPAQGTLEDNGDGTLTYTPSLGFAGVDTFTYTVSDGGFDDTAAVRIGVDNTAPVAGDDSGVTDEDTALVIDALANDGDPDGDVFGVVATSDPANGSVTINPDGTLTYVPDANFNGADSFTYTLGDGVASTVATVDVAVTSIPDAPIALDDSLSTAPDTPLTIDFAGDLLANDSDGDGDPLFLDSLGVPSNGTLVDNGDGTFLYMPNSGFVGTDSFTYTINDGTGRTATAAATIVVADFIDVWYGTEQTFGQIGEAQEWINILGNVDTSEVVSLAYSLNGGPDRALTIGPNTRRLQNDGDFNVEISYSELDGSATDDVVTIKATLSSGNVDTEDVIIHYESGHQWTPNYSIDWGTVTNLQDVVQVADGLWEVSNGGARPVELGYDRLLTFGDQSWDNYALRLSVTTHDLLNVDPSGRDGGAFIIGMLWTGHTDTPVAGTQPKSGWEPGAAFSYSDPDGDGVGKLAVHPSVNSLSTLNSVPFALETGFTYNLLVQVEQVGLFDRMYSLKLWEDGDPEPAGWTLQGTQTFSITEMPLTGSAYLNAHYYDVTYNDLTVTEIPGRDIVHGSDGNDILAAVDAAAPSPGRGEIDVFVGHEGSDVFVFGDEFTPYYDDGIAGSSGQLDYGFIWDFVSGADTVQLHGSENDYLLTVDQGGLPSGTAIWLASQNGEANELIAVLNNATGLDLASQDFVYTDLFV